MTTPNDVRERLGADEFTRRFTERLVAISAGKTPMTEDEVRAYAAEVAPSYFEDWFQSEPESTPEDWAEEDFDCWEAA